MTADEIMAYWIARGVTASARFHDGGRQYGVTLYRGSIPLHAVRLALRTAGQVTPQENMEIQFNLMEYMAGREAA